MRSSAHDQASDHVLRPVGPEAQDGQVTDPNQFESAMERCRRGETAAFGVVYDELIDVVWRVIGISRTETQDAEQLAEAVFVELWRQAPVYDQATCSPRRWAMTVALDTVGRARDAERGTSAVRSS